MYLNFIEEMITSANMNQSVINLDNKMNISHSISSLQSNSRAYWDTKYMCSNWLSGTVQIDNYIFNCKSYFK